MQFDQFCGETKNIFNENELISIMYDYYRSKLLVVEYSQKSNDAETVYNIDNGKFCKSFDCFTGELAGDLLYSYDASTEGYEFTELTITNMKTEKSFKRKLMEIVNITQTHIGVYNSDDGIYIINDINFNELYKIKIYVDNSQRSIVHHKDHITIYNEEDCMNVYDIINGKLVNQYKNCIGVSGCFDDIFIGMFMTDDEECIKIYKNKECLYELTSYLICVDNNEIYISDNHMIKQIDVYGKLIRKIGSCKSVCGIHKRNNNIIIDIPDKLAVFIRDISTPKIISGNIVKSSGSNLWVQNREENKLICYNDELEIIHSINISGRNRIEKIMEF